MEIGRNTYFGVSINAYAPVDQTADVSSDVTVDGSERIRYRGGIGRIAIQRIYPYLCRTGAFRTRLPALFGRCMVCVSGVDEVVSAGVKFIPMESNYEKEELFSPEKVAALAGHYKAILELLGEDASREGLLKTPERVAKAMSFLTQGYGQDPKEILLSAKFKEEYKQMVIVKDIELYSMCEHHMIPFYGKAHVAYIPNGYITGLSKIARVVEREYPEAALSALLVIDATTGQNGLAQAKVFSEVANLDGIRRSTRSVSRWLSRRAICACRCAACKNRIAALPPRPLPGLS